MFKNVKNNKRLAKLLLLITGVIGVLFAGAALAGPTAIGLTQIAGNIDGTVKSLSTVMIDVALIAGVGFVMASFFKFHQHKLNPTQVPVSHGVTLLLIGAGLMLVPTLLPTATKAVFGTTALAKTGGSQIHTLITSGSGGGGG